MARPRWQYLLLFLAYLGVALAASPTSFCKCTCASNSTIIPLDSSTSSDYAPSDSGSKSETDHPPAKSRSCADCTKSFCLSYNLPICKDVKEEEVFTTCFQRDSAKDEAVVWIFLAATVGLLGWAAVKPAVGRWRERREGAGMAGRGQYARVGGQVGTAAGGQGSRVGGGGQGRGWG